ncbi:serine protease [Mesorhizobium sp. SP-1A]|uniref:S1C family serine protease n=1 Tax=Mesorhizobium sp. SP-1A TaxID=3077840 RepID=UPI0028F6D774|nr:serine protease [Mesorhizobium sp. SP-1A]
MFRFRLLSAIVCFSLGGMGASAEVPSGAVARWVVLASSKSIDDAIGIASVYQWRFNDIRVVRSSNGWLAVVGGPVPVPNGIKAAKKDLLAEGGLPKDLFMSNGAEFQETIWQPERTTFPKWQADSSDAARFETSSLQVTVDTVPADSEMYSPRIIGRSNGQVVFSSVMSAVSTNNGQSSAMAVPLDPASSAPEIVFSAFWGGAHCCTVTEIYSSVNNHWTRTEASTLDGGGYTFQDIDHDGSMELVSYDNSFYYAFAPYAYSWAPKIIEQLRDGVLSNQSHNSSFTTYYRRELAGMEHLAQQNASLWNSNGFLAAWVATKALVGEFDDAWPKMLASFDRANDWQLQVCSQPINFSDCPDSAKINATFPVALRAHLQERGYLLGTTQERTVAAAKTSDSRAASPKSQKSDTTSQAASSGTGFFVTTDGEIITNFHVIDGCQNPLVLHGRSPSVPGAIIARDETNDLALLKVEKKVDQFAHFNVKVRLGEPVAAFGYPLASILSSGGNFTLGSVTALSGLRDDSRYLQTSAPVQPGNSGGPLVDYYGNVAGIVTGKFNAFAAMVATGDIVQNVNFAIRSSTAVSFLLANGVSVAIADGATAQNRLEPPDLADFVTNMSVAIRCD